MRTFSVSVSPVLNRASTGMIMYFAATVAIILQRTMDKKISCNQMSWFKTLQFACAANARNLSSQGHSVQNALPHGFLCRLNLGAAFVGLRFSADG